MVYLLFISLLLIFLLSWYLNKKDIISPSVIFSLGFLFQSIWVLFYSKKWDLSLHLNTYLTITVGVLIFVLVGKLTSVLFNKYRKSKKVKEKKGDVIIVEKWKKIVFLCSSIAITLCYLYFVVNSVGGKFNSISSIAHSISEFDRISKFTDTFLKTPFLLGNLRTLVISCGFWFMYVEINNYIYSKKLDWLNISIIIVSLISTVLSGSRTGFVFLLVAGLVYVIAISKKKNNNKAKFNYKILCAVIILGIGFLLFFPTFARILGRNINEKPMDYLAIYCGAEVKNLDLFLQEDNIIKNNKYFGTQTFQPIITTIGRKIGFIGYEDYKLDLPFRKVNNSNLGNVYTTFYPYIYDFGYIGVIVLVSIMAIISQLIFEYAMSYNGKYPSICSIAYGLIFGCLLLSFFSNKFYETIITADFMKKIIIWYLCNLIFCKFDYKVLLGKVKYKKD